MRLRLILDEVLKTHDFTILEGHRSLEDQQKAFESGASKAKPGQSKHNSSPSRAVDIAPYPIDFDDIKRFTKLAEQVFKVAQFRGIPITWGGFWGWDYGHYELLGD